MDSGFWILLRTCDESTSETHKTSGSKSFSFAGAVFSTPHILNIGLIIKWSQGFLDAEIFLIYLFIPFDMTKDRSRNLFLTQ